MLQIAAEAADDPQALHDAPHARPVRRLDEVKAAKLGLVRFLFDEHPSPAAAAGVQAEVPKGA
jgi:hypothetical protein